MTICPIIAKLSISLEQKGYLAQNFKQWHYNENRYCRLWLFLGKFIDESKFVSGIEITDYFNDAPVDDKILDNAVFHECETYDEMLDKVDTVYVISPPSEREHFTRKALEKQKHVLCETPIALNSHSVTELYGVAKTMALSLQKPLRQPIR